MFFSCAVKHEASKSELNERLTPHLPNDVVWEKFDDSTRGIFRWESSCKVISRQLTEANRISFCFILPKGLYSLLMEATFIGIVMEGNCNSPRARFHTMFRLV